jgi:glycosyltransferase involved in cell wall biosynthesis
LKIIVDCSNLRVGGGIQVALSFFNDLVKINIKDEIIVFMSPEIAPALNRMSFPNNFLLINLSPDIYCNIFVRGLKLFKLENEIKPEVIFTVFGPSYHKSRFPKVVGFAIPYIIYTDSPFFLKLSLIKKIKYKVLAITKLFFFRINSDALIFETNDARLALMGKIGNKINMYTVGNTLNSIFNDPDKWTDNINIIKSEMDIFCLSANYPHKNLDLIPNIIDEILILEPSLNFKFYISAEKDEFNFSKFHNNYVNFIGRIELENLPHLYSKMDINFMPTLLEIFSTTYLEAMFMGVPIVCSDMSFARDTCSDSAIYCEPINANDYAKKLLKVISNKNLKQSLIENGRQNLRRHLTSMERTYKYLDIINTTSYEIRK